MQIAKLYLKMGQTKEAKEQLAAYLKNVKSDAETKALVSLNIYSP